MGVVLLRVGRKIRSRVCEDLGLELDLEAGSSGRAVAAPRLVYGSLVPVVKREGQAVDTLMAGWDMTWSMSMEVVRSKEEEEEALQEETQPDIQLDTDSGIEIAFGVGLGKASTCKPPTSRDILPLVFEVGDGAGPSGRVRIQGVEGSFLVTV